MAAAAMAPAASESRALYGGAITCSLPLRFLDISPFRQVPDHQEVFTDADSDQSVIFEVLEEDADVPDANVCEHYFQVLADANESANARIIESGGLADADVPLLGGRSRKFFVRSEQAIAKFHEKARNLVIIHTVILRLTDVATDLLIHFNFPVRIAAESSSARAVPLSREESLRVVQQVLSSFKIVDWKLFGAAAEAEEAESGMADEAES